MYRFQLLILLVVDGEKTSNYTESTPLIPVTISWHFLLAQPIHFRISFSSPEIVLVWCSPSYAFYVLSTNFQNSLSLNAFTEILLLRVFAFAHKCAVHQFGRCILTESSEYAVSYLKMWLTGWLVDDFSNWGSEDWLIDWLTDWPSGWLSDWVTDWSWGSPV